jgi:aminopeptidase N
VEAYVGPEVFRKGVNAYLEKHAYGNATAEDFWNQLTATSGKPVDKIMASFTDQAGAPLVTVRTTCRGNTTQVALTQERYVADAAKLAGGSSEIWQIPVNLRPEGAGHSTYRLLTQKQQTFELPGCSPWVYVNAGGRGHFRSDYDSQALSKMGAELEISFSSEERIHFVGDVWAMVRVGRLNIGDYLSLLEKMRGERSRALVGMLMGRLPEIHDNLVAAADRASFQIWVHNFLRPIANDLGDAAVPGESDDRRGLRSDVFGVLASYGRDPQLLAKSRAIVDAYRKDSASVDAALAGNALAVSALEGGPALYDQYIEHLKTAKTPEEYYNYFGALGQFPEPELTKRTFEFILSPAVKNQDLAQIGNPLFNYASQAVAWDLFKTNFKAIRAKAGETLGPSYAQFAGAFCDSKLRDDSQEFFAAQQLPGSERVLQNARDTVNSCIELRGLQQSNLSAYLKKSAASSTSAPTQR